MVQQYLVENCNYGIKIQLDLRYLPGKSVKWKPNLVSLVVKLLQVQKDHRYSGPFFSEQVEIQNI